MNKNERSKRNKKILAGAGALACVALLAGTYAWLQSEDEKSNKFTGILAGNNVEVDELWEEPGDWTPGQTVVKEAGALNTGEYDEFVRMSFNEAIALLKDVEQKYSENPIMEPDEDYDPLNGDAYVAGTGWNIPVSEDTIALYGAGRAEIPANPTNGTPAKPAIVGKNWKAIAVGTGIKLPDDYTQPEGYALKGFQSPAQSVTNNNNGTTTTIYNYFFYWEKEGKYYEAQVDSTKTEVNGEVTLKENPQFIYISAEYQPKETKNWMEEAPNLTFTTPGVANGTYMGITNPITGDDFTGKELPAKQLPTAANPEDFGFWQQRSQITGLSFINNDGTQATNQAAAMGINFINVLSAGAPEASSVEKGQGINRWVYNSEDGYFYYLNIVKGGQKSANLLNSVKMLNEAGNAYMKVRYNLDVKAEAVQAIGDAVADEWLKEQTGDTAKALTVLYQTVAPNTAK